MKRVTIRVPATTANLGPGFDAFGCALSLYTDVTFEETDFGLEITGCPEEFTGPDNLVYTSYCAVLNTMSEEVRGVKIHIDAHIPICRGLGSSAALLVAGAMGANVLRGNKLSTQGQKFPVRVEGEIDADRKTVVHHGSGQTAIKGRGQVVRVALHGVGDVEQALGG